MTYSRRQILKGGITASLALIAGGCGTTYSAGGRPAVPWPRVAARPDHSGVGEMTRPVKPAEPVAARATVPGVLSRGSWTRTGPIRSRVNPMNGIRRITLHHEGLPDMPVYFTDRRTTVDRLELIRSSHLNRGWGDIGYHFIVDRAGNVWEARPLNLQGAHVRDNNEHNIGIMMLGNFEIQSPSDAQLAAMQRFVKQLGDTYRVPSSRIHTHQELNPTSCPGRNLQPRIAALRSNGAFA